MSPKPFGPIDRLLVFLAVLLIGGGSLVIGFRHELTRPLPASVVPGRNVHTIEPPDVAGGPR